MWRVAASQLHTSALGTRKTNWLCVCWKALLPPEYLKHSKKSNITKTLIRTPKHFGTKKSSTASHLLDGFTGLLLVPCLEKPRGRLLLKSHLCAVVDGAHTLALHRGNKSEHFRQECN